MTGSCALCGRATTATALGRDLCSRCQAVAGTREDAPALTPAWDIITAWLLVLAALLLLIVGWDHVVNGIEVLALILGITGAALLAGRTAQ